MVEEDSERRPEHVLVAYDGSEQAAAALSFAREEWPDAAVRLLYVIDPTAGGFSATAGVPAGGEEWYDRASADAEELLAEAADSLAGEVETDTAVGRPAEAVVEYAEEHDVDHVVVGSHGRTGVSRVLLGSVAEAVVRSSPVPVTVVR